VEKEKKLILLADIKEVSLNLVFGFPMIFSHDIKEVSLNLVSRKCC
jgi:hypothetical protein